IEFCEGKNVLQHHHDVCLAFINVNDQRIGNLPPWVGLNARRPAARPEMGAALSSDICQPAQHRILAFAVELQVPFLPDANTDHSGIRAGRISKSGPLLRLETYFSV